MFIRIIRGKGVDTSESLFECARLLTRIKENTPEVMIFTMEETGKGAVSIEIDKREPEIAVYVMNEKGRTIDTHFSNRT